MVSPISVPSLRLSKTWHWQPWTVTPPGTGYMTLKVDTTLAQGPKGRLHSPMMLMNDPWLAPQGSPHPSLSNPEMPSLRAVSPLPSWSESSPSNPPDLTTVNYLPWSKLVKIQIRIYKEPFRANQKHMLIHVSSCHITSVVKAQLTQHKRKHRNRKSKKKTLHSSKNATYVSSAKVCHAYRVESLLELTGFLCRKNKSSVRNFC